MMPEAGESGALERRVCGGGEEEARRRAGEQASREESC